jgi:hypothetical protein
MKIKNQPENLIEWIALKANLAPIPLIDTQVAFNAARAIMAAAELGVYEAIGKKFKNCRRGIVSMQHASLKQQDICLMPWLGIGYLQWSNGNYTLKQKFHKWLLKESESNLIRQSCVFNYLNGNGWPSLKTMFVPGKHWKCMDPYHQENGNYTRKG